MEIKTMKVSEVVLSPRNPREITAMEFAGLKDSIRRFGLVEPLVMNKRNNHVVGGNQRLKAIKELDFKTVEVVVVDLDDMQEDQLNITLNNKGIQGEYTEDVLKMIEEIRNQDLAAYDSLRMFDIEKQFDQLMEENEDTEAKEAGPGTDSAGLDLELYEHYDYLVIASANVQDWNWLCEFFEIKKVKSDRRKAIGTGRAVRAADAITFIKAKGGSPETTTKKSVKES